MLTKIKLITNTNALVVIKHFVCVLLNIRTPQCGMGGDFVWESMCALEYLAGSSHLEQIWNYALIP